MARFLLDTNLIAEDGGRDVEAIPNVLSEGSGVVGGVEQDDVTADLALQFRGSSESYQIPFVHDRQAVAALSFFHEVGGDQYGNMLFVAKNLQILPKVAAGARIKASRRFVEKQNAGMM